MGSRKCLLLVVSVFGLQGCDFADELQSIQTGTQGKGTGKACRANLAAVAAFENNFGLQDFCVDYKDHGAGIVNFDFSKEAAGGIGKFSIELPHTETGHVFNYSTKDVLAKHSNEPGHCELLKSSSEYPMVTLVATDGNEMVKASSLDCDQNNYFDVTVNTLRVADRPGDKWLYELSATYSRLENGPYYLKGSFEVVKQ
jgi:hypothetical protein